MTVDDLVEKARAWSRERKLCDCFSCLSQKVPLMVDAFNAGIEAALETPEAYRKRYEGSEVIGQQFAKAASETIIEHARAKKLTGCTNSGAENAFVNPQRQGQR